MFLRSARRLVFGLVLALACALASAAPAAAEASSERPQVVVVGFSGVTWRDVTPRTAPNLYGFGMHASTANLVVRTINETTCPIEGWLTVGAGQRVVDGQTCRKVSRGLAWDELARANARSRYHARLGQLGQALRGMKTAAIGPGAALALADSGGRLHADYADLAPLPGSVRNAGDLREDPAAAARAYLDRGAGAEVAVADLGSVRHPDEPLSASPRKAIGFAQRLGGFFTPEGTAPPEVASQIETLDARFGELLRAVREKNPDATVIVMSVADSQSTRPHLGYFAAAGPRVDPGQNVGRAAGPGLMASSDATRQWGLVQITDVLPTILGWLAPDSPRADGAIGSPLLSRQIGSGQDNVRELVHNQTRSQTVRSLTGPFFIALGALVFASLVLFLGRRRWPSTRKFTVQLAALAAAVPVASLLANLVPWWRSDQPTGMLIALLATISAAIAALALAPFWKDAAFTPFGVIGGLAVVTLMLDVLLDDVLTGYPLQLASLFGTQPLVGWRFYGFSNSAFALFAAGLVLSLAWAGETLRSRGRSRAGLAVIGAVGVAAVFLDGSAHFGADFGGPPVLVVGIGMLTMMVFRVRLTWLRLLGLLALAVAVSFGFAVADYLRPASGRSHLGRFVESLLHGDGLDVVVRKFAQIFGNLPWPVVALIVVALAGLAVLVWRMRHRLAESRLVAGNAAWQLPVLRIGVLSLCTALLVGMMLNDSGLFVPILGLAFALPLCCVGVMRHEAGASQAL